VSLAAHRALVLAASSTKSSGSSSIFFLVILVGFGAVYWFVLRPQQARARKTREQGSSFEVGDEIVTVGGIVGTVLETDGDRVTILSGGGGTQHDARPTRLVLVRQAIARKVEPTVSSTDDEHEDLDADVSDPSSTSGTSGTGEDSDDGAGGGDGAGGDDGDGSGEQPGRKGRRGR
jgi:preprotein translocase subunit YajC